MHGKNAEGQDFSSLAEIIEPDMSLKYRVGGRPGVSGFIRREAIEKAERAVHQLARDYINVARGQIAEILARFNQAKQFAPEGGVPPVMSEIAMIAREIKGQARSCGYDLLTEVAESLYGFITGMRKTDQRQLAFIEAHIDVLQHIATYNLSGNGGQMGQELMNTIIIARKKLNQG